ncbi:LamB/YcsF family protein [Oscillochloris sp. ZM17-4]|uniref:5-oxoprolinase subunit PxpA n=1 Tax=Oscillochloris sp. ZM17-4 TaxID=2866714 RepID=UPI001C72BC73|nr:5-oxoprolinase subunit PxpA [Oscillochloris sp. ZM17-4]MBX0326986.1 LamB/YcsF family protein [Oscillochloris sp. ZM17-4]
MPAIDLNCDCGESFGPWPMGDDSALLPHVTSANVACGGHAGDPATMRRTVRRCKELGVSVGAHPGYPDLQGFGRRSIPMDPAEIEDMVLAQLGALHAIARAEGVELRHMKAHGALYNDAARAPLIAQAIARAVAAFSRDLVLVGLAGSAMISAGEEAGLRVAREAFADRAYEPDGSLRSRSLPDSLITDPARNLQQAMSIIDSGFALSVDGLQVPIWADTLCIHGDTPGAAARAAALRAGLVAAGIEIRPY